MAKYTLLEMVKKIMSDMDSDSVDSITDTVESEQVASVLQDIYDQMTTNQMIPEKDTLGKLNTVDLTASPGAINYLEIPDGYARVQWIKYDIQDVGDTSPNYQNIEYRAPDIFMEYLLRNTVADNTVLVTDPGASGVQYYVTTDVAPRFFTSFDDHFIAFDAINKGVDTIQTLGPKSLVFAQTVPTWTMDDDFIPAIDDNMFPYLLAEAKSTCFVNLKQQANPKIEKQAREQRVRQQNHKFRSGEAQKNRTGSPGPNYGR